MKRKKPSPELIREMKEFTKACERGEVASGNWCTTCQQYGCGCEQSFRTDMENDDKGSPPNPPLPSRRERLKGWRNSK
jgi:hypothetical protein